MAKKEKFIPRIKSVIKNLEEIDDKLNTTEDISKIDIYFREFLSEFKYLAENKQKVLNIKDQKLFEEAMVRSCLAYTRIGTLYKDIEQKERYFGDASIFARNALKTTQNEYYKVMLNQQLSELESALFQITENRVHVYNYFESESQIVTANSIHITPKRRRDAKDNLSNLIRDQFQEGLSSTDSLALAQRGIFHKRNKDWEIHGKRLI